MSKRKLKDNCTNGCLLRLMQVASYLQVYYLYHCKNCHPSRLTTLTIVLLFFVHCTIVHCTIVLLYIPLTESGIIIIMLSLLLVCLSYTSMQVVSNLIMPRCACAPEAYGNRCVFVCVCVRGGGAGGTFALPKLLLGRPRPPQS